MNDYVRCNKCSNQYYVSQYYKTPIDICPRCESVDLSILHRDNIFNKLITYLNKNTIGSKYYFYLRFFPFILYYNLYVLPNKQKGKFCHFNVEDEVIHIKAARINNNWHLSNKYLACAIGTKYKICNIDSPKIDKHHWEHYTFIQNCESKHRGLAPNYLYMRTDEVPRILLFIFELFRLKQ